MIDRKRRRVLVAGGAGFLGSHLCAKLVADGCDVMCVDNLLTGRRRNIADLAGHANFTFVEADVIDALPPWVSYLDYDEVYNLACAASPPAYQADPEHTLLTNVVGTQRLLRIAERSGARFLLTSTSEVYGDPLEHPQREEYRGNVSSIGPRACYDEGKRAAETLAFDFDRAARVEVRVARIFNTYGPRLHWRDGRVIPNLIAQALEGRPLTVYGDGGQTRSFCFVDDMVAGLIALMRCDGPQPGPVNLGNPAEITVSDLAGRIAALTGTAGMVTHATLPVDDPRRRRPDISRAVALLGWRPATSLDTGLIATIAWHLSERDMLAPFAPAMSAPPPEPMAAFR